MPDTSPNFNPILTREEIITREAQRRQLLQRLDSKRATIRMEAIAECQHLLPREISMLVSLAERRDEWHFPARFKGLANFIVALTALGPLIGIVHGRTNPDFAFTTHFFEYLAVWVALALAGLIVNGHYHRSRYSLRVKACLQQIVLESRHPDIFPLVMRMLQIAIYAYDNEAAPSQKTLYDAAARWLLILSPEQIRAYAIRHEALYLFLAPIRAWKNEEITLRVLSLLEQLGTTSAIPVVKYLTQTFTHSKSQKNIKHAAHACLTALQERERQRLQPEILLRAASAPIAPQEESLLRGTSAPEVPPAMLLRPLAAQATSAVPEQLLRSSSAEE